MNNIQNTKNKLNNSLIKQKKFEDIIEFYKKMEFSHHLSISDSYAFILANELLNIINTKNISQDEKESLIYIVEGMDLTTLDDINLKEQINNLH